ncbi:hypothetical protein FSB65_40480 [Paraburkholderia sp. JPY418]|nr:hypothetical protein [Paraburkholderia youngii]
MQFVDSAHQQLARFAHRLRPVIHARSRDAYESRPLQDRQCVRTIDYGFARRNPALLIARLKNRSSG